MCWFICLSISPMALWCSSGPVSTSSSARRKKDRIVFRHGEIGIVPVEQRRLAQATHRPRSREIATPPSLHLETMKIRNSPSRLTARWLTPSWSGTSPQASACCELCSRHCSGLAVAAALRKKLLSLLLHKTITFQ